MPYSVRQAPRYGPEQKKPVTSHGETENSGAERSRREEPEEDAPTPPLKEMEKEETVDSGGGWPSGKVVYGCFPPLLCYIVSSVAMEAAHRLRSKRAGKAEIGFGKTGEFSKTREFSKTGEFSKIEKSCFSVLPNWGSGWYGGQGTHKP